MRIRHLAAHAALGLAAVAAPAVLAEDEAKPAGTTFHFGANEARTTILFESETSVEVIHGITHTVSGAATFDFEKGEGVAELRVPVKSLDTGLAARNGHLQGEDWLEADKYPEIVFRTKGLKRTGRDEAKKRETWTYEGEITIHGVTKPLKGEATVQRVPEELGRTLGAGAWVKVKTAFPVTLKDFDIEVPEVAAAKVSPTWDVKVDIFGTTELPKPRPAPKQE